MSDTHHLRGLPTSEWNPEVHALLDGAVQTVNAMGAADADRDPLPTLSLIAHQPRLLGPFLGWAAALAIDGVLDPRHAEILALRVSVLAGSEFEWREHSGYGRLAGLTDADFDRIEIGPSASEWNDAERALLQAADELDAQHTITPATYAVLAATFSPAQIVEAILVCGQYRMLSTLANTGGVDDDLPPRR